MRSTSRAVRPVAARFHSSSVSSLATRVSSRITEKGFSPVRRASARCVRQGLQGARDAQSFVRLAAGEAEVALDVLGDAGVAEGTCRQMMQAINCNKLSVGRMLEQAF